MRLFFKAVAEQNGVALKNVVSALFDEGYEEETVNKLRALIHKKANNPEDMISLFSLVVDAINDNTDVEPDLDWDLSFKEAEDVEEADEEKCKKPFIRSKKQTDSFIDEMSELVGKTFSTDPEALSDEFERISSKYNKTSKEFLDCVMSEVFKISRKDKDKNMAFVHEVRTQLDVLKDMPSE